MASNPVLVPGPGVTWIRSDVNLGVTAGRNRLLAAATSEVVVFLDDDAVFTDDVVEPLRTWFDQDRLAIVAFRVRRPGGGLASSEYPFRGQPSDDRSPRECTYFVGAAFAARRSAVLVEVGGQDEELLLFHRGGEDGLRLIGRGWRLIYDPGLVVEHRPSLRGRSVAPRIPALRLCNRLIMVRRHLPIPIAAMHAAIWGGRTFREARAAGNLRPWARAWREGLRTPVEPRPPPVAHGPANSSARGPGTLVGAGHRGTRYPRRCASRAGPE